MFINTLQEPSPEARQQLLNLPTSEIRVAARRMRKQVDDMTLEISKSKYFNEALGDDMKAEELQPKSWLLPS